MSRSQPYSNGAQRQLLRTRRFLSAAALSAQYLLVLAIGAWLGIVDDYTFIVTCVAVSLLVIVTYVLFAKGWNRRFKDPSLTAWQIVSASTTMLLVAHAQPRTAQAFGAFLFVCLMFGMLRYSGVGVLRLAGGLLLLYALSIAVRFASGGDASLLREQVFHWVVLAGTVPWFIYVGGTVKRLRDDAQSARSQLDEVEQQARIDQLTGVFSRRALVAAMKDAAQQADSRGEPLSLCVIDLDHFKRFNDQLGHLHGDEMLRSFANVAASGLRESDVLGRYGGEEFVQVLPRTPAAGAYGEARRLSARVRLLQFEGIDRVGPITVSIGVAQHRPGEDIFQTFARADQALLSAKQNGRDRIELAG